MGTELKNLVIWSETAATGEEHVNLFSDTNDNHW
jgi:hypothetical protein